MTVNKRLTSVWDTVEATWGREHARPLDLDDELDRGHSPTEPDPGTDRGSVRHDPAPHLRSDAGQDQSVFAGHPDRHGNSLDRDYQA